MSWISKTGLLTISEMENNEVGGSGYERPSYDPATNHAEKRKANANYCYEYYTDKPPTPTPPTPGKGIPKELIVILQNKRGLHKL